jgi:GTP-binding protein
VPEGRELADFVKPDLEARGYRVFEISTVSHEGLRQLSYALGELVETERRAREAEAAARPRIVIRPQAVNDSGFKVVVEGGTYGNVYRILGEKPQRWVAQTDFTNDEAVGYLGDRLARLGVEDELLKQGAKSGCAVTIGDVTFDWEPQTPAGVDVTMSGRGTDLRLEQDDRVRADERKIARKQRRESRQYDEQS